MAFSMDDLDRIAAKNVVCDLVCNEDDPYVNGFKAMGEHGLAQVRVIPAVGAEQFAKYIFEKLNTFVQEETSGRVKVVRVEFMENNKNTAIYEEKIN